MGATASAMGSAPSGRGAVGAVTGLAADAAVGAGVAVGSRVGVGMGAAVGAGVIVGSGAVVGVGVAVGTGVAVAVGTEVGVGKGITVGTAVAVGGNVGVGTGLFSADGAANGCGSGVLSLPLPEVTVGAGGCSGTGVWTSTGWLVEAAAASLGDWGALSSGDGVVGDVPQAKNCGHQHPNDCVCRKCSAFSHSLLPAF